MATTNTDNLSESKKNANSSVQDKAKNSDQPVAAVKQQLTDIGSQFKEYLNKVDTKIDGYKFSIEKHNDGLTVDFSFRATIRPKDTKTTEKVV